MIHLPAIQPHAFGATGALDATQFVDDPHAAPADARAPGSAPESDAPDGADPLARFGSMYGLHAQARQAGGAHAPTATSPLDKPGLEGGKAWMEHGNRLLMQGKYNEAIHAYEQGFLTYPDRAFLMNKATALHDAGRYAEAILACESYLSDPQAPRADEVRAMMERARSHMNGVEPTATGIEQSKTLFEAGTAAYRAGKYNEALAAFEDSYRLNPRAETKYNIAACLDRAGHKYTAIQRYGEYLNEARNPADRDSVERRIAKLKAEAPTAPITATGLTGAREWMHRGNELLAARRFNEAADAFRAGYREYPSHKLLLNEAAALADGGRHLEADLVYSKYLADPNADRKDEARAAQERLRTNHLGGRAGTPEMLAEARHHFDGAMEHYHAGRYAEALAGFDKAYSLYPLRDFRYNQAACLDKLGQREMAALRYEAYLSEGPKPKDASQVEARIAKLRAEVATLERDAFDRGQQHFVQGDFRKAAHAFAEAFSHKPRPEYLFNMATAYEKAGDIGRAIESLEALLRIAPDAKDADAVRAKLAALKG